MSDAADGYAGQAEAGEANDPIKATARFVTTMLSRVHTATPVQVLAVTPGSAGGGAAGTVDVQPLVNQVDGAGQATPHGTVHGLPYFQLAAGTSAVVLDPVVGDIGLAVFASRDVSTVKATRAQSNPGSFRRNSMSDGFYFGGFLTKTPAVFVRLEQRGITIKALANVTLDAPDVATTGNLHAGTGASGTFSTATGQVVTVRDGIIVNIF